MERVYTFFIAFEGRLYGARIRDTHSKQLAKLLYDHGHCGSDADGIDVCGNNVDCGDGYAPRDDVCRNFCIQYANSCAFCLCSSACRDTQRSLANALKSWLPARPVRFWHGVLFDHRDAAATAGASLSIDVGRLAMVSSISTSRPCLANCRGIYTPQKSEPGIVYRRLINDSAPACRDPQRLGSRDLSCCRAVARPKQK